MRGLLTSSVKKPNPHRSSTHSARARSLVDRALKFDADKINTGLEPEDHIISERHVVDDIDM